MKTKVLKTIALAAAMLAQVGGAKAQSYTTEVYDFKTWSEGSPTIEFSGTVSVTSTEANFPTTSNIVSTAFFNGRFAHTSNTSLTVSSGNGIISGKDPKRRLFSVLNLQRGDVVIIEGSGSNTNVYSNNAVCISDEDGSSTTLKTATAINWGAEYVFTADDGTFDIGSSSSSSTFTITKVTIKKLNAAVSLSTPDLDYQFKNWYAAGQYTSALSSSPTSATGGATVYAETATFNAHDISRMASSASTLTENSDGLSSGTSTKNRTVSVLGVNENDKITIACRKSSDSGAETLTISSEKEGGVAKTTSISTSGTSFSYIISQDGTFDMNYNTGKANLIIQRITIIKPQTMTIGATGYRTFCSPEAIDISGQTNFDAYYASSEADGVVTMTKITDGIIPANTAVMLYGTSGTFYYTTATGSTDFSSNLLQPVVSDAQEVGITYTGKTTYVLAKPASTVCFAKLSAACTDMGGKAYLLLPNGGGARQISFNFDNEATDISTVNGEGSKVNGCESAYSLSGQRVGKDYKGLVIKNGKKYIIK